MSNLSHLDAADELQGRPLSQQEAEIGRQMAVFAYAVEIAMAGTGMREITVLASNSADAIRLAVRMHDDDDYTGYMRCVARRIK